MRRARPAVVGVAACAALAVPLLRAPAAQAAAAPAAASSRAASSPAAPAAAGPDGAAEGVRHVVIVGISGLRWSQVTAAGTPELWRLAGGGSVGSLVDYAQQPLSCPADGWLTLNAAARAQGPRPCTPLPEVVPAGAGASVPAMPQIIADNRGYHESPDWGLLGSLAGCATAVGPGAALALASPAGAVSSYLPSAGELSAAVLARCPLTVVDLGQIGGIERTVASAIDGRLASIVAELPAGTLLLVTSPGAAIAPGPGSGPAGPAPDDGGRQRPGVRRRSARLLVDQATGDRDAHRPDPDGGRLARPPGPGRDRRRADRPDLARQSGPDDPGAARPGHRRTGLAGHPRLVPGRLRAGRRARLRPARAAVLGRRPGTPPRSRPLLADRRRPRGRGPARQLPR